MAVRKLLCASSILALASLASPALAQEAGTQRPQDTEASATDDEDSEERSEIVITGTSIRGIAPVGSPVLGFNEEDIRNSGTVNTVEFLRQVPQIVNIGADEARVNSGAQNANANTMRASGINIRGLGPQATLTLIDGHRPAPAGLRVEFFDVSAIPTIALSGIEIVADGASAIYGSDAIAGVANLRLRRNFDGVQVTGRYTIADGYDARQISGIVGHRWSTGDIMLAAEYYEHSNFLADDRPDLFLGTGAPPSVVASSAAVPRYLTDFSYPANLIAGGVTYAIPDNPTGAPLTAGQVLTGANRRNLNNIWDGVSVLPSQKRFSFVGRFSQEIGDRIEISGHGFFSRREFDDIAQNVAAPATTATITVRNTNPYATFLTGLPGAPTQGTVRYSFINDFGTATFFGAEEVAQGMLAARVDLFGDWQARASVARSWSSVKRILPAINTCALTGAATNVSGPCTQPGGAIGQTSLATAFNPFGPNGEAVLSRIRAYTKQAFTVNMTEYRGQFDGTLFRLPGGNVRAAFGAGYIDWRNTYLNFGNAATANNTITRQNSGGAATQEITSLFGEIVVPVFGRENAIPGFRRLDLSAAVRMDDYSLYEDPTVNPKLGLSWEPVDGLRIHASYSTSFRSSIKDRDPENAPNVVARVNNYFDYSINGNTTAISFTGGNADVVPETSETWTVGLDWQPPSIPGLHLSVTYFDIAYRNIIETSGQSVNTGVFSAEQEATYAPFITRRPPASDAAATAAFNARVAALLASPFFTGATVPTVASVRVLVDGRGVNSGTLLTDGFDLSASYTWDGFGGSFFADLSGTYYLSYKRSLTPTVAPEERLNDIDFPTTYRFRAGLGWSNENIRFATFLNYLPSYNNVNVTPAARVGDYATVDANLSYTFGDERPLLRGLTLGISARNLFDADPPFALVGETQTFDSQNASFLGRLLTFEITKRF